MMALRRCHEERDRQPELITYPPRGTKLCPFYPDRMVVRGGKLINCASGEACPRQFRRRTGLPRQRRRAVSARVPCCWCGAPIRGLALPGRWSRAQAVLGRPSRCTTPDARERQNAPTRRLGRSAPLGVAASPIAVRSSQPWPLELRGCRRSSQAVHSVSHGLAGRGQEAGTCRHRRRRAPRTPGATTGQGPSPRWRNVRQAIHSSAPPRRLVCLLGHRAAPALRTG